MPLTSKQAFAPGRSGILASLEKRNPIVCLLLAVVTLALYNPVNRHPFVNYDDDRYVTQNPHVREGLTASALKWALTSTEQANWHPMTWISHALDCSLFRLNPAGHHFTSVLLHALNVVVLFLVLMWATNRLGASLFVAALFAVHPINVESVAWIAERKNVLCTLFFFLTLWAYGWYVQKPGWRRYLVVAGLFAAGLASKPMVITLPFVLLLLDYWPLRRVHDDGKVPVQWSQLVLEKMPLLAFSAASAAITVLAQKAGGAIRTTVEFSFGIRLANAVYAYCMYLWKLLWPARLAPLYPHPGDSLSAWRIVISALILIGISAAVWRFRNRRYLLVGWLWFLGTLVPVIGLVQVGEAAMADRYAYIPLIGIFGMMAFSVDEWVRAKNRGRWASITGAAALIALAAVTHHQIGYWQSNSELWAHAVAVTENNFVAENNLGGALILDGKEEEAHAHFEAAARINPRDPMSRSNLGTYAQNHGRMREAEAHYQAAIALTSDPSLLAPTYASLGAAQFAQGEDQQAYESLQRSLQYNLDQFRAWLGLGQLARKRGHLQEAIDDFSHSVEAQPTGQGFLELGRTLAQAGRNAEALQAYEQALKISPNMADAQAAADVLRQKGR